MEPGDTPGVPCPAPVQVLPHFGEGKNLVYYKTAAMPRSACKPLLKPPASQVGRSWSGGAAALGIINEQQVMGKARIN